jgi:hypothetical protein
MMRMIQVRAGHLGYRDQLDRMRRFLERVEGQHPNEVVFQDMVWAFFQNCYHVRDWICKDPLIEVSQVKSILAKANESQPLQRCGDLCNGTKHLCTKPTRHSHVDIVIKPGEQLELDCIIDVGCNQQMSAKQLARECVVEWERILQSEGLATARTS